MPDALVGHVLYERFLIEDDISDPAAGSNCVCYVAKDLRHFCRKVVVRTLNPGTEWSVRSRSFQDICKVLMQLGHPNIEVILETGKLFDGRSYAVTAYTDAQSLRQATNGSRRLVVDRVAQVVESVGEALGAAHTRKIIHGDVAPANIMITPPEQDAEGIRLVSFGTAWPDDPGQARFADMPPQFESLPYTAPELLTDDGRATPASDIYSLAAVAWRMLTGEVPFEAAGRAEMLELVSQGIRVRPSDLRTDLSADAEAILLSALQYKAAVRPRDARIFGRDLADALRGSVYQFKPTQKVQVEPPVKTAVEPKAESIVFVADEMPSDDSRKKVVARPPVVSDRVITWSLIIFLLAGALSIPIVKTIRSEGQKPPVNSIVDRPAAARLPREIKYSIEGQNIRNGALTVSQPMPQNSFVKGGEYRIAFEADSAGNAYVFTEAVDEQGRAVYELLYPMPKVNGGAARVEPGQQVQTRTDTVGEERNTKIIWLVWTAGKQDDLEAARGAAIASDGVVLGDNELQKLKHFLERNKNNRLNLRNEGANNEIVLTGSGDRLVHRIELERN